MERVKLIISFTHIEVFLLNTKHSFEFSRVNNAETGSGLVYSTHTFLFVIIHTPVILADHRYIGCEFIFTGMYVGKKMIIS